MRLIYCSNVGSLCMLMQLKNSLILTSIFQEKGQNFRIYKFNTLIIRKWPDSQASRGISSSFVLETSVSTFHNDIWQ